MFFNRRAIIGLHDVILNPFAYVVDRITQEENSHSLLNRYNGWTFAFILQDPEPAI